MRDASLEFRKKMYANTNFYQTARILFADGRGKELGKEDFFISGSVFNDGAGTSSFPLGEAMAKHISITLINDDDRFSDYDFYLAKITVYLNYPLSSTIETICFGTFTVTTPESYGTQIVVEAMDDMYKADKEYTTSLSYPAALGDILKDSCSTCGVPLLSTEFKNMDFTVNTMPQDITHRQLWGMCAMLAGGNARMDKYNQLCIISYDFSYFENHEFDGGVFDAGNPYETGVELDGGSFSPWDTGVEIDGGDFAGLKDYHFFYKHKTPNIPTDDVVITGIKAVIEEEEFLYGSEGYVLDIENPLIEGNPQTAVDKIGELLVGIRFRPFSIEHIAYPLAEFGDICYLADRKGNVYQSVVTDVEFNFYGRTIIQCAADSPVRNSSQYTSSSTKAIVAARKETAKQIAAYDLGVQRLTNLISNSFGVFKTEEVLEDGSVVYYLHNKPELAVSSTIWKMTADAFAVSTDGGKTWNAGMDSNGNAVVNVLSAIGINANWINTGTLCVGGKTSNIDGEIKVFDADGNQIGILNKSGIELKGSFYSNGSYVDEETGETISYIVEIENGNFRIRDNSGNYIGLSANGTSHLAVGTSDGAGVTIDGTGGITGKCLSANDWSELLGETYIEKAKIASFNSEEVASVSIGVRTEGQCQVDAKIRAVGNSIMCIYGTFILSADLPAGESSLESALIEEALGADNVEEYSPKRGREMSLSYYGNNAIAVVLSTSGNFSVRNLGTDTLLKDTNVKFKMTYILI